MIISYAANIELMELIEDTSDWSWYGFSAEEIAELEWNGKKGTLSVS